MPRLRPDQFNCKGSVPTYLSDMKDGEIRVTDDGVYCKYGTHIYKVDWDAVQVSTTSSTTSSTSTTASSSSTTTTSSTTTSTTVTPMWVSHFDNTEWVPSYGFLGDHWDGSGWQSGDYSSQYFMHLTPIGGWTTGYRPSKVRITFTGVITGILWMRDTNTNDVVPQQSIFSGQEFDMTFTEPFDLNTLELNDLSHTSPGFKLTNIEFLP